MHNIFEGQFTEIHAIFGRSYTVLEHRYKDNFVYYGFKGKISRAGLNFIFEEGKYFKEITYELLECMNTTTSIFLIYFVLKFNFTIKKSLFI
jgi:hypothetical protein